MIQVAKRVAQTAPPEWVRDELSGATGKGIRVAVLDSGWDRSIDDPRVLPGTGFVDPDDDFAVGRNDDDQDVLGHGTACAGVILEVAPDARVIPVKVFGNKLETSPSTLEAALHWAMQADVQVINVSLGTRLQGTLERLYVMCELARRAGIIVVAAAHNGNEESYPAIFEPVIGVSAARFESPYHFRYRPDDAHECEGWGVDRPVLWIGGERVVRHGTSFAAPGVAGIVALIRERYPKATLEDVREMLARFALPEDPAASKKRKRGGAAAARSQTNGRQRPAPADEAAAAKPATKPRKRTAAPEPEAPARPATKPKKRTATAEAEAPAKPAAKSTKRTAAADQEAPAKSAARSRKRTAPAQSEAPAKSAAKPKKRTGGADQDQPASSAAKAKKRATDQEAPAKPATASRKRTAPADQEVPAQPPTKSRKRTAAADPAPAKPASKPRKRSSASAEAAPAAADAKPRKRTAAGADQAARSKAASRPRKKPAGNVAVPAKPASKPRKQAAEVEAAPEKAAKPQKRAATAASASGTKRRK